MYEILRSSYSGILPVLLQIMRHEYQSHPALSMQRAEPEGGRFVPIRYNSSTSIFSIKIERIDHTMPCLTSIAAMAGCSRYKKAPFRVRLRHHLIPLPCSKKHPLHVNIHKSHLIEVDAFYIACILLLVVGLKKANSQ